MRLVSRPLQEGSFPEFLEPLKEPRIHFPCIHQIFYFLSLSPGSYPIRLYVLPDMPELVRQRPMSSRDRIEKFLCPGLIPLEKARIVLGLKSLDSL